MTLQRLDMSPYSSCRGYGKMRAKFKPEFWLIKPYCETAFLDQTDEDTLKYIENKEYTFEFRRYNMTAAFIRKPKGVWSYSSVDLRWLTYVSGDLPPVESNEDF